MLVVIKAILYEGAVAVGQGQEMEMSIFYFLLSH